jgi:hypothetical protein
MVIVEVEDAEVRTLFSTWEVVEVVATDVDGTGVMVAEE